MFGDEKKTWRNQETAKTLRNIETICKNELQVELNYVSKSNSCYKIFPQLGYAAHAPSRAALMNETTCQPEELKSKINSLSIADNIVCKQ